MSHLTGAAVKPVTPHNAARKAASTVRVLRLASSGALSGAAIAGVVEAGADFLDLPVLAIKAIPVEMIAAAIGFIAVLLIILYVRHREMPKAQ
jgi:hypothetical protein